MKFILKPRHLIVVPESSDEREAVAAWKEEHTDHVFHLSEQAGVGMELRDLGPRPDACREPVNISSKAPDPALRLIGNFAATPFALDGAIYGSIEGFWQSLKFEVPEQREKVGRMSGPAARSAGQSVRYGATVSYLDRLIRVGTFEHWALMERACWAKFTQNEDAKAALLATGDRPLAHRVRRDSETIPGVIMAEIWMKTRHSLRST